MLSLLPGIITISADLNYSSVGMSPLMGFNTLHFSLLNRIPRKIALRLNLFTFKNVAFGDIFIKMTVVFFISGLLFSY